MAPWVKMLPGEKARLIPRQASNWQLRRLGLNLCFVELSKSGEVLEKLQSSGSYPATGSEARAMSQQ